MLQLGKQIFILSLIALVTVQGLLKNQSTVGHPPFKMVRTQLAVKYPSKPKFSFPDVKLDYQQVYKEPDDRNAVKYTKWGVDNEYPHEYWFDHRIHTFGNTGFWGAIHAAIAPLSTKIIDNIAYKGVNIRQQVAMELSNILSNREARVVDLCCGVGISTRALREAFPASKAIFGVDASPEMIAMANFLDSQFKMIKPWTKRLLETIHYQGKKLQTASASDNSDTTIRFLQDNAEHTHLPSNSVDLVTIMYAFHEAPKVGRARILSEARRLLHPGGTLAVVDISPNYGPSKAMLAGEPYVIEYQQNIQKQLRTFQGFIQHEHKVLVPGHVSMWILKRDSMPLLTP